MTILSLFSVSFICRTMLFSKIQFICYQHYLSLFCLNMYIKAFICLKLICLHKSCLLPSPRLSIFSLYLEYLGFFLTSTDMINLNLPLLRLFSFLNPVFNYLFSYYFYVFNNSIYPHRLLTYTTILLDVGFQRQYV